MVSERNGPPGFRRLEADGEVQVWVSDSAVVVIGWPLPDPDHNCDQMGCGFSHVLLRARLEEAPDA